MPETIAPPTVPVTTVFADTERLALAGFLSGYSGQTRSAYTLDLRQYTTWCAAHGLRLFGFVHFHAPALDMARRAGVLDELDGATIFETMAQAMTWAQSTHTQPSTQSPPGEARRP